MAFLGFATRKPYVRFSFDGRWLICWEAWHVRALTLIGGTMLGPGLTILLISGNVKPVPWYMDLLLLVLNAIAWLGWLDALRNRYQIKCDLVSREVKFFLHPARRPKYSLDLDRVIAGVPPAREPFRVPHREREPQEG